MRGYLLSRLRDVVLRKLYFKVELIHVLFEINAVHNIDRTRWKILVLSCQLVIDVKNKMLMSQLISNNDDIDFHI